MISNLWILLLVPFGGFGEDEIVDETTQTPNDVMTTAQEQNKEEDNTETETETVTESVDPVPKSITIETKTTLKLDINLSNTTEKK